MSFLLDKKNIAVALLAAGLTMGMGKLFLVSVVIFLWDYWQNRDSYNLKESILYSYEGRYTVAILGVFIFLLGISTIFAHGNNKMYIFRYFDRILPLVMMLLFCKGDKNFLKSALIGACLGIFITCCTAIVYFVQHGWRPRSLLGNPNELASIIAILLPFIMGACLQYFDSKKSKLMGIVTIVMMFLGLYLTGSRGPTLSLVAAIALSMLIFYQKGIIVNRRMLFYAGLIALAIGVAVFKVRTSTYSSDMERICLWQSAWSIFKDYPIFGVGLDNFNNIYRDGYMMPLAKNPALNSPHNIFLHYMAEAGIVGLLGFVFMIGAQIKYLLGIIKDKMIEKEATILAVSMLASIAAMLVQGLFDALFLSRDFNIMYWFLWGITCCSIWAIKQKKFK